MILDTEVEVKEGVYAEVSIDFNCISHGYPSTFFEPAEYPEFEIVGWELCGVYTEEWEKSAVELEDGDWREVMELIVGPLLDNIPDLYERQYDAYYTYS